MDPLPFTDVAAAAVLPLAQYGRQLTLQGGGAGPQDGHGVRVAARAVTARRRRRDSVRAISAGGGAQTQA